MNYIIFDLEFNQITNTSKNDLKSNILISDIKYLILYQNTSVKNTIKHKSNLSNIVYSINEKIDDIIVW